MKYFCFIFLEFLNENEFIFDKRLVLVWLFQLVQMLRLSSWLGLVLGPMGIRRMGYNTTQRHY